MDERVDFFLPLYVRDFIAATLGWTAAERGHYLTLLMVQWDRGGLPGDLESLERLSGGVGACWALLEGKFPLGDDGLRRNRRLEEHRTKALEARKKRAEAGRKGGRSGSKATPNKDQSDSQAGLKQCSSNAQARVKQPEPEPEPYTSSSGEEEVCVATPSLAAPTAPRGKSVAGSQWHRLLAAWKAGPGAAWSSNRPPQEAIARLADPAWLEEAVRAIDRLRMCKFFVDPVDLVQFCGDGFVSRVLGGRYDKRYRSGSPVDRDSAEALAERWREGAKAGAARTREFVAAKRARSNDG